MSDVDRETLGFDEIRVGILEKLLPFERIIETIHFAQKTESSLLQVADVCAFALKRDIMKASHSDRLYNAIRDYVIFKNI